MKKIIALTLSVLILASCSASTDHQRADRQTQDDVHTRLQQDVPAPEITGAAAREAVSRHLERWQSGDVVSFVTLFADTGQPIGYYEASGKVASTCQMLTSPDRVEGSNSRVVRAAPALDGTYYPPGMGGCPIFFFTATGDTYVEWSGKYLVTDQPLPIDVEPLEVSSEADGS